MRLNLLEPFKSLKTINTSDLPDFIVLTGKNGTGKSQLIDAITKNKILINQQHMVHALHARAYSILPPHQENINGNINKTTLEGHWSNYQFCVDNATNQLTQFNKEICDLGINTKVYLNLPQEDFDLSINKLDLPLKTKLTSLREAFFAHFRAGLAPDQNIQFQRLAGVANRAGKGLFELELEDIVNYYPLDTNRKTLLHHDIATLFTNYRDALISRNFSDFLHSTQNYGRRPISLAAFIDRHGPSPWEVINDHLRDFGLGFRFSPPHEYDRLPYTTALVDIATENTVPFSELSSGESLLVSLALCDYHLKYKKSEVTLPSVLLLDEIDAPLHPAMAKKVVLFLYEQLHIEHGLPIILTTHSPTTVALSPEDSIYVMKKEGERIFKATKDEALQLLLDGVPTLSVDYENRRQVFVEDESDVAILEGLYSRLRGKLNPNISLSFMSAGKGDGGKDRIKHIVSELIDGGNKKVRALLDRDSDPPASHPYYQLGGSERYNIENFILDPLLVGLLWYHDRENGWEVLGLPETQSIFNIQENREILQSIANKILTILAEDHPHLIAGETCDVMYANGVVLKLPLAFCNTNGHDYCSCVLNKFLWTNRYKNKSGGVPVAIVTRVLNDVPGLIPSGFLKTFQELQAG
ncbi:AAA family ATPase [Chitinolyticbacter meiyuanensis]|uniref:AAA family ATPase n=1 Tax=Chitinolyticbacter meiyuanensis TaxID=682798 RepID=UPI0011E5AC57|nr:AAA family ATPase [Chitinolyticbacter meiyuanensis]